LFSFFFLHLRFFFHLFKKEKGGSREKGGRKKKRVGGKGINLSVVQGSLTEGRGVLNHRRLTKLQCTFPKAGGM
jgi:hypothetical protein